MTIRLVVADDHPIILTGLSNLFQLEKDFELLANCGDGAEAMQLVRLHQPDVVVLDIRMPRMDGLEVARRIREEGLSTRLVLLTAELDEKNQLEAIRLGVDGIVLKEMAPQLLVQCIRKVHAGGQWVERQSMKQALEGLLRREAGEREVAGILTPREVEMVRLVTRGLHNREIAGQLCISEGTVKSHLHNVYEKLRVDGRMTLLKYAREKGLE